jgi:hypothetical protein
MDRLGGYTPFQATKKMLDDEGIYHQSSGPLILTVPRARKEKEGLLWALPWCEEQLIRDPLVQMYDNTYKTNNKGLALFQMVGINNLGKCFSCAFGLINT